MVRFHLFLGFAACFIMWIFFLIFPHLDITIAGHYYDPSTHVFVGSYSKALDFLHLFAMRFPIVFSIVVVLFLIASLFCDKLKIKHRKEILFVAVCLWVGPGLVVNSVFKDHWGRPRPAMIEQLGGDKIFQPPFVISNECGTNCSFVSGDPSMGFWLFALMPLFISRRKKLLAFSLAVLAGGGLGWMRIAQGGHFFSDVVFCGIFVYITTWLVYWAMYRKKEN